MADTLATVKYQDGSFVSFYEFEPGEIAIRHAQLSASKPGDKGARVMASDQVSRQLDQMSQQKQSLVDVYKAIAANPEASTIKRLTDAQARVTRIRAENPQTSALLQVPATDQASTTGARTAAATGCTPDYFNDNYGAQWFIDNYINENRFRRHRTNVAWASFGLNDQSWAKVCAMAPDFETGIHFRGQRFEPGGFFSGGKWVQRWAFDIGARGVECWYINSTKTYDVKAQGYDPCQRVHIGVCSDGL